MKMPIVFMYSGQGSQYYQMGRDLYDNNATFKKWMLKADRLVRSITNLSIIDQLYDDTHTKSLLFTQILLTHPAIFMVEYALTQVMFEKEIVPDIILGTSMGEFAAAAVAGVIDFETGIHMVIKQAQALETCPPAGMLAILHSPDLYDTHAFIHSNFELASVNFTSHFVVTGSMENLAVLIQKLNEMNITSQLLPVSQGFHSSWIDSAKIPFLENLETSQLKSIDRMYFSCMCADYQQTITLSHLWEAIRRPIRFQESIKLLEKQKPHIYIDLGPTGTLATFIKYNLSSSSQSRQFPILTLYGDAAGNLNAIQTFIGKCITR